MSVEDASLAALPPAPPGVRRLAFAIARAEGFGVPGAVPTRAHNPGDLKIPNWTGPVTGAEGISVFATDADGWTQLYRQLLRIVHGRSHVYTLDMTIWEMGIKWTDTHQSAWSHIVAETLGVPVTTTLRAILAPPEKG